MKTILIETMLVSASILFWTVALPAAVVLLPAVALWEKIGALLPRGRIGPARPMNSQDPGRIPLERAWSNVRADLALLRPSPNNQETGAVSRRRLTMSFLVRGSSMRIARTNF